MRQSFNYAMTQFLNQRLRLLQILRIKPFGKPSVNLRQQFVSFFLLPLLLPQAREAGGRSQLPGLGLLMLGDGDGLEETLLRLCLGVRGF